MHNKDILAMLSKICVAIIFVFIAANAFAADLTLFLRQASRSGPEGFVKWTEQYYAERKAGKSGFQGQEAKVGSFAGAIMGGGIGSLKDDMFRGMKEGYSSGKKAGAAVGNAYGAMEGRSQKMETLITDYINDRQPMLDSLEAKVTACTRGGENFSSCRASSEVERLTAKIAALNFAYCRKATAVPSPLDANKTMLPASLCAATD